MRQYFSASLKGFAMGAANLVPGVSGGTIALITGIYSDIIAAISSFTDKQTWRLLFSGQFKAFFKAIKGAFLIALAIGILLSIFSLTSLMEYILANYPILTWAFFFGLIIASSILIFRDIKTWNIGDIVALIVGLALGILICTLTPTTSTNDLWFIFVCGAISICTMILPGVSGSFVLLIMGKYDYIINSISSLNWPVLAVFAFGCVVGLLVFARLLRALLARYEKRTMIVLLGFVLGSLVRIWPWADKQRILEAEYLRGERLDLIDQHILNPQIGSAIVCCVAAIALVIVIDLLAKKKAQKG